MFIRYRKIARTFCICLLVIFLLKWDCEKHNPLLSLLMSYRHMEDYLILKSRIKMSRFTKCNIDCIFKLLKLYWPNTDAKIWCIHIKHPGPKKKQSILAQDKPTSSQIKLSSYALLVTSPQRGNGNRVERFCIGEYINSSICHRVFKYILYY